MNEIFAIAAPVIGMLLFAGAGYLALRRMVNRDQAGKRFNIDDHLYVAEVDIGEGRFQRHTVRGADLQNLVGRLVKHESALAEDTAHLRRLVTGDSPRSTY